MTWVRLLALACALLVPLLQRRIDDSLGRYRATEEILYLWSGEEVRRLFPGFELLMADVYWIRTVQYFGGQRAFDKDKRFELLEPLIDITVTLDPRFEIAYRYGATFLAEPWPLGAARPEDAARLLERGAQANPRSWLLQQNLGFFVYYYLGEPQRAARLLLAAAQLPDAPAFLTTMAADFLGHGGDRETARGIWRRLHEQSEEGPLRRNAARHLELLDADEQAERLQALVNAFRQRAGRNPSSLLELTGGKPAADPSGTPFAYDAASGVVGVSTESPLWRQAIKPRPKS